MGYILKNTSGLINTRITDTGRLKISQGNFNISYFQIGDSEVSYNALPQSSYNQFNSFVLEPSFNAQNSAGVPQSNKENVKYPYYVDGTAGNTYGIPFMASIVEPVYNRASPRGFFTGTTVGDVINWSAKTNNTHVINSNYIVDMSTLIGTNTINLINNSCNDNSVRSIQKGDIVTIYFDGNGISDCICITGTTTTTTTSPCVSCTEYQISVGKTSILLNYTGCSGSFSSILLSSTAFTFCTLSSTVPTVEGAGLYNLVNLGECSPNPCPTTTTTTTNPCVTPIPTTTTTTTTCSFINPCCPPPPVDCLVNVSSCYTILTYRVIDVCNDLITLDRTTPDFSTFSSECYARVLVYPPVITEIYDSITPSNHWSNNVINYESVCYTDEFDVKIWNMNIPWSETPAGIDPNAYKDYTKFGSINYLGSKEYFGYASSSGQTDTSSVYYYNSFDEKVTVTPEQQKAISIVHYTNQTVDLFYGEKFALEPFDDGVEDTTGQARNFRIDLPWIMWHKNPNCCNGQSFYVDPPGFDDLNLFTVHHLESTKNSDMNTPGIRYYHLWDTNPNLDGYPSRVGKVFPDSKIIIFDDEEIIASMSYKSNRNWTLPAPKVTLITPNVCGVDNNSIEGILTGSSEYLYVTYRLSNTFDYTNSLHCNYYSRIQGPNVTCNPIPSQNVAIRFGSEFPCLNQLSNVTTTTTTVNPCPCWYDGIILWIDNGFETPGSYIGLYLYPTTKFLNGQPIYVTFLETIYNFYFNGTNWVILPSDLTDPLLLTFDSMLDNPIGDFSYDIGENTITGFSTCDQYKPFVLEYCEMIGLDEVCNNLLFYPSLISGELVYIDFIGSGNSLISYNGSNWIFSSGSTEIAILPGLTIEDSPLGNWTVTNPSYTSVSSTTFLDVFTLGCQCVSLTENCGPCAGSTELTYVDCYGVINEVTTDLSLSPYTGCVLTISGIVTTDVINLISGDDFTIDLCESVCTTTTTINPCNITTTTTTLFPVTTTTTLCPTVCDLIPGFFANKFEIICQKVDGTGRPQSDEWKIIDFTDQLSGSTINGFITQQSLTANTFVITQDLYDDADIYDLSDYIDLTTVGFTGHQLNFGDEYYFYGNIETDIQATIYEMKFLCNLASTQFTNTSNPTWFSGSTAYVTEIGLFNEDKELMVITKLQSPILRQGTQQYAIKIDF